MMSEESPEELATAVAQALIEEQTLYQALLKHHYVNKVNEHEGAVLDSGSSKHISPKVFAPDLEDRKSLSGFDNSQLVDRARGKWLSAIGASGTV